MNEVKTWAEDGRLGHPAREADSPVDRTMGRPASASFRVPEDRKTKRAVKTSGALRFYREILGLDHLHYGLWEGEEQTLEGLRSAQERLVSRLVALLPKDAKRLLDVGSGSGAVSLRLKQQGLSVEGLSPDPYQQELYDELVGEPFHLGRFQEFEPAHPYDVVLMSESSQYIWLDSLFAAVRRSLDDGTWLLADYFVVNDDGSRLAKSGHPLELFLDGARRAGFELDHDEDITESVLPTLELGRQLKDRYVRNSLGLGADLLRRRRPWVYGFFRRLLGRHVAHHLEELDKALDAEAFARVKQYKILRFRVPPA